MVSKRSFQIQKKPSITSYDIDNSGFNNIVNNYRTTYSGLVEDSTAGSYKSIAAKTASGTYSWPYTVGVITNKYLYVLIGASFLYSKELTDNYLNITQIDVTIS